MKIHVLVVIVRVLLFEFNTYVTCHFMSKKLLADEKIEEYYK